MRRREVFILFRKKLREVDVLYIKTTGAICGFIEI
jgi:hypothetical protein